MDVLVHNIHEHGVAAYSFNKQLPQLDALFIVPAKAIHLDSAWLVSRLISRCGIERVL